MPKSVRGVMREFKHGQLHSGSSTGRVVKNPKQAIAIALSEQRQLHPKMAQRAQMTKEAHAHLRSSVPEYHQASGRQKFMMAQHHVNLRLGKVK